VFSALREQFLGSTFFFVKNVLQKCVNGTVLKSVAVSCVRSRRRRCREVHNVKVRKLCSSLVFKGDKILEDDMEGHVERRGQMYVTVWSRETGCGTCI